jgi:Kef-type K+ transport system membrane component KefB
MIKTIAVILAVGSFVLYQYMITFKNVDLSELYFISSALSISAFSLLSLKKSDPVIVKSLVLLCASFFAVAVWVYVYRWVIFGDGSTYYFTALSVSAVISFIYTIGYYIYYYVFKRNKPFIGHK